MVERCILCLKELKGEWYTFKIGNNEIDLHEKCFRKLHRAFNRQIKFEALAKKEAGDG